MRAVRGKNAVEAGQVGPWLRHQGDKPGDDVQDALMSRAQDAQERLKSNGRETDLSGQEAYAIYGQEVQGHLAKVGGQGVFGGQISRLTLGEVEDLWDMVAIAMYPSKKAMLQMISDPDYIESAKHRAAGLEGQPNIETKVGANVPFQ
jgi:uncharacterized protein (DUF1330 family)